MESKIFTRDDIKAGYLLVVKDDGDEAEYNMTVIPNNFEELCCCSLEPAHWWPLYQFDMHNLVYEDCQIIKVYGCTNNYCLLANSTVDRDLLWERPKGPKKMTVAEICAALGYDVEIVK